MTLVNAGQIAKILSARPPVMSQTNIRPWLRRRGIKPAKLADGTDAIGAHPIGRLYSKAEVIEARDKWYKTRDRDSDENRSRSALAKAAAGREADG